ncbi:nitrilase-related carbon-nitrogen hydrolase [Microlunatus soli]|uniref:Predicted amidohydrolase n=1 Tax=Microlunatus soli TaxID=630515 RepID=A0A1H1ZUH4_9ACTN|nr:nitrilase-related carbon-nitrogen hydrolase [Microlunatus soli]SDT37364.1 Predicted amidohydrolase [Microlunatus soli]
MPPVVAAACQIGVDIDGRTTVAVEAAVAHAAERGADLIVLPEQCVSGFAFADAAEARDAAEPVDGATVGLLRRLSAEHRVVIIGGYPELGEDGHLYNSAALVQDGDLLHNYRKVHLWGAEVQWFTPGSEPPAAVDTRLGRIAVMICYDLELPEWPRLAALDGADVIVAPCNWPLLDRPETERPLEIIRAQAAAGTNKVYVVVADRCGPERGVDWIGGTAIVSATGYLLAGPATGHDEQAEPTVLTGTLDLEAARDKSIGPHNDALADRRPTLYHRLSSQTPERGHR